MITDLIKDGKWLNANFKTYELWMNYQMDEDDIELYYIILDKDTNRERCFRISKELYDFLNENHPKGFVAELIRKLKLDIWSGD